MAILNFPDPGSAQTYTENGITYNWDGVKWVRESSSGAPDGPDTSVIDGHWYGTLAPAFDGTTTTFALTSNYGNGQVTAANGFVSGNTELYIGGVIQREGIDYDQDTAASTITFTEAPATGLTFWVRCGRTTLVQGVNP